MSATIDSDAIATASARWAADQVRIGDLVRENEALRMRCKAAEESLALYKPALRDANARCIEAMNELAELKAGR